MIESDAKSKWCPMFEVRAAGPSAQKAVRGSASNCIGSNCMAWRYSDKPNGDNVDRDGYCGLANEKDSGNG